MVEAMWEAHRAKLEPMREAARQSHHVIKATLSADPFGPNAYANALEGSLSLRTAIRASHYVFMIELTGVLTPEQRVKLTEHASDRRWRHQRE